MSCLICLKWTKLVSLTIAAVKNNKYSLPNISNIGDKQFFTLIRNHLYKRFDSKNISFNVLYKYIYKKIYILKNNSVLPLKIKKLNIFMLLSIWAHTQQGNQSGKL